MIFDIVRMATLTYYRIKCVRNEAIISDIYKNIDKCFVGLCISVPHNKQRLQCLAHVSEYSYFT